MSLQYENAHDVKIIVNEVIKSLGFDHIFQERVLCVRSRGSKSDRIVARIHGLPKIWQKSLTIEPHYIIEVLSEHYDRLELKAKEKILIHELLHIPKSFGGGFRHHKGWITESKVENLHLLLIKNRELKRFAEPE